MKELYEMESTYIECDCHMDLLQLTYEEPEDIGGKISDDYVYMSFYEYGNRRDNRFAWKDRLKHIWYILRYGTPWKDSIVLRTQERLKLTKWLQKVEEKRLEKQKEATLQRDKADGKAQA